MRVRATAMAGGLSNAIGAVELECSPAGLLLGLYGVSAYQEGYAPAALATGTRFLLPYAAVSRAVLGGGRLYLELDFPGFPHDRLTLTRFSAGPGVPKAELARRRLILHAGAVSFGVLAAFGAAIVSPSMPASGLSGAALGYGLLATLFVLLVGYAFDASLFERPPDEAAARDAFAAELSGYVPHLVVTDRSIEPEKPRTWPNLASWLPRGAAVGGVVLAATVLTALVAGQRSLQHIGREPSLEQRASLDVTPEAPTVSPNAAPKALRTGGATAPHFPSTLEPSKEDGTDSGARGDANSGPAGDAARVVGRCACDRADSPLWRDPIPRLSAILIERRVLPRKTRQKLRLEVAVVNNGDSPVSELTLHVLFSEKDASGKVTDTTDRPLYFEGPLLPGQAIKWATEARATEFEILVPDLGTLGVDGTGAASRDTFATLLEANHRPVRLHAARMLSYLGDPRGRAGALQLKEALRAAEGPYLRRVLDATSDLRVCDLAVDAAAGRAAACVYNAGSEPAKDLGIGLASLAGSVDVSQPLANPPELTAEARARVPGELASQAGVRVDVALPAGFLPTPAHTVEASVDRFDLLD